MKNRTLIMPHNEQLRIFVDCHVFDGEFQGTRTYIQGMYLELIKDTTKHFFLAASDTENLKSVFGTADNVTYLKYRTKSKVLRLLIDAPLLILQNRIDFAHFQYRVPPLKFCRYIVTVHDVLFEDFPQYFPKLNRKMSYYSYKFSAQYSDVVLTVSQYSRERIKEHLKTDSEITPNGVAEVFFEDYNKEEVQRQVLQKYGFGNYIIYISRWEPRKNHHLLLKTFAEMGLYKNYRLLFIGEETFKNNEYEAYYAGLPEEVKEKVVRFGRVGFQETLLLLRAARLSVYPSIAEGFGIPPLESVAAGVPTLSSNTTAMADFDFPEEYQFNPNNEADFRQKLAGILSDDATVGLAEMKEKVRLRYNWAQAANAFNRALQKSIRQ